MTAKALAAQKQNARWQVVPPLWERGACLDVGSKLCHGLRGGATCDSRPGRSCRHMWQRVT